MVRSGNAPSVSALCSLIYCCLGLRLGPWSRRRQELGLVPNSNKWKSASVEGRGMCWWWLDHGLAISWKWWVISILNLVFVGVSNFSLSCDVLLHFLLNNGPRTQEACCSTDDWKSSELMVLSTSEPLGLPKEQTETPGFKNWEVA